MSKVTYDWDRYGHPRIARFNRATRWVLPVQAAVAWPMFAWLAIAGDWTLFFAPLLITAGAVLYWVAFRKVYGVRHVPDYGAIARMEREIYGKPFRHEGASEL